MSRLQDARVWIGGGVVAAVLILVAGWFLLLGPQLAHAADLRDQASQAQADNAALQGKVGELRRQNAQLPSLVADLRQARSQLPAASDLAGLTTEIGGHAAAAHVAVTSLTVAPATAAASTAAPAASGAASDEGGSGAAGGGGAAGAAASPAPSAPAAGATAPGATGKLYEVPVTVVTTGSLAQQRIFLTRLSTLGPRAVLVGSTQLGAGGSGGSGGTDSASLDTASTMTTNLTFFVAPLSAAADAQLAKLLRPEPAR